MFEARDEAEIGEKGLTLSGGEHRPLPTLRAELTLIALRRPESARGSCSGHLQSSEGRSDFVFESKFCLLTICTDGPP